LFPGRTDRDPSQKPLAETCERILDPFNPWTWIKTAQRIRELDPELLLFQWWVPFWAPVWISVIQMVQRGANPRILFISHNIIPHEAGFLDRLLARLVMGLGDAIIVHSQQDRENLLELIPQATVRVTAHPTYEALAQDIPDTGQARQHLGLAKEKKILLFFGFVRAYKGLHYLIQALPAVLAQLDAHLVIAGEFWDDIGPYRERIEALNLAEHITIYDHYISNEELGTFFAASDLVVLPYVDATQSGVVQLAFGFGIPVVTTTVGGLAEAVEEGITGHLVTPADSQALSMAILDHFQQGLGPAMRVNIQRRRNLFSWTHLVYLIEELAQA